MSEQGEEDVNDHSKTTVIDMYLCMMDVQIGYYPFTSIIRLIFGAAANPNDVYLHLLVSRSMFYSHNVIQEGHVDISITVHRRHH